MERVTGKPPKVLTGPEKIARAIRKAKYDRARKAVNKSLDRSIGSLRQRRKREIAALNQSFVIQQAAAIQRKNKELVNEYKKVKEYSSRVEKMNLQFRGQHIILLMKIVSLETELKNAQQENDALNDLLSKFREQFITSLESIDTLQANRTSRRKAKKALPSQPIRVQRDNNLRRHSSTSSEGEFLNTDSIASKNAKKLISMLSLSPKSRALVTLDEEENEEDAENLPSFVNLADHEEDSSSSSVLDKRIEASNRKISRFVVPESSSKHDAEDLQQQDVNPTDHDDSVCNNSIDGESANESMTLALPESPTSSFLSSYPSTPTKASCGLQIEENHKQHPVTEPDRNRLFARKESESLLTSGKAVGNFDSDHTENINTADDSAENITDYDTVSMDITGGSNNSTNSEGVAKESHITTRPEKSLPKPSSILKAKNTNVRKKSVPSKRIKFGKKGSDSKDRSSYDIMGISNDSIVCDEENCIKLGSSKSLSPSRLTTMSPRRSLLHDDENLEPSRRSGRRRATVSYAEPSLNAKMRRGDRYADASLFTSISPRKILKKSGRVDSKSKTEG